MKRTARHGSYSDTNSSTCASTYKVAPVAIPELRPSALPALLPLPGLPEEKLTSSRKKRALTKGRGLLFSGEQLVLTGLFPDGDVNGNGTCTACSDNAAWLDHRCAGRSGDGDHSAFDGRVGCRDPVECGGEGGAKEREALSREGEGQVGVSA